MSQHRLAPRPHHLRRPAVRRGLQLGAIVALVAATVTSVPSSAQASPEQILQSVAVSVSPDGTISTIRSSTLAKDDGDASAKVTSIDPSTAASSLPVRVLTSYVLGHQTGTDLDDIVGKSGTVTINVSVQNTTVRPEKVSYNSGGVQKSQYALVGAPFTVVGSATLGKGDLAHVVTVDPAHPTSVTTGVLSQASDGTAHVQWAAMLAPPRLPASTTFTLVEKTSSFRVPTFDFNVQPGLDTDTSMQAIVAQAFSDDGSTQQLETKTISLIGNVNSVLAEAGVQLNQIRGNLTTSSDSLGVHTISDLQSGRQQVTDHLTSVIGDLQRLRDDISAKLHDSQSSVLASLDKSLDGVINTVGTPGQPMPRLTSADENCAATVPVVSGSDAGLSVLQQLRVVGAQLAAIQGSMPACRAQIKTSLEQTVGNASQTCPVFPPSGTALSAICTLRQARSDLGDESSVVVGLGGDLKAGVTGIGLSQISSAIDAVVSKNGQVQHDIGALDPDATSVAKVIGDLTDAKTALGSSAADLQSLSFDDVISTYKALNHLAGDQLHDLGDPSDGSSVAGAADTVAGAVGVLCGEPTIDPTGLGPVIGSVLNDLTALCAHGSAELQQITDFLAGDASAWTTVQGDTDTADLVAANTKLKAAASAIGDVQTDIDQALADDGSAAALQHDLTRLEGDAVLLDNGAGTGAIPSLRAAYTTAQSNADDLTGDIDSSIASLTDSLSTSQHRLDGSVTATDNARATAESTVDTSIDSLSDALASSRGQLLTKGQKRLSDARGDLTASGKQAAVSLGKATDAVVQSIATSVASANTNLSGTSTQLSGDLAKVLTDIGTRQAGGTGILGTLATSAATASVSSHNIAQVSATADDFRHVRSAELDSVYLQQQQTDAALELQQQLPAFAITVPAGSHVLTVYSFHLGG